MPEARFDLIIIGGGPAGHVAAERAGALGKKVLVAEKSHLGGVCLNQGCIPTKTLLYSAKLYAQARHSEAFGVTVEGARYDLAKAMAWKTKTIETIRKGIAYQFRTHGVELATGTARIVSRDGGAHDSRGGRQAVLGAEYPHQHGLRARGSSHSRGRAGHGQHGGPGDRGASEEHRRDRRRVHRHGVRLVLHAGGHEGLRRGDAPRGRPPAGSRHREDPAQLAPRGGLPPRREGARHRA